MITRRVGWAALVAVAVAVVGAESQAALIAVTPDSDITLDAGSGNQNTRPSLLVGQNNTNGPYGSLVAFDMAGLVTLGVGDVLTVNSVTIDFSVSQQVGSGVDFTMRVDQYDFAFDRAVATYEDPAVGDVTDGGTLGTSFGTLPIDTGAAVGSSLGALSTSAALESAIETALTSGSFFRVRLGTTSVSSDQSFVRISRETGTPSTAGDPVTLNVDYTITNNSIPEPASLAMFLLGGLGLLGFRRERRKA